MGTTPNPVPLVVPGWISVICLFLSSVLSRSLIAKIKRTAPPATIKSGIVILRKLKRIFPAKRNPNATTSAVRTEFLRSSFLC